MTREPLSVTSTDTDLVSAAVAAAKNPDTSIALQHILKLLGQLTEEERHIGRPLRGHTKLGCHCRYCKSVLNHKIVLNGEEES